MARFRASKYKHVGLFYTDTVFRGIKNVLKII